MGRRRPITQFCRVLVVLGCLSASQSRTPSRAHADDPIAGASEAAATALPPLSDARRVGRANSTLLSGPGPSEKTTIKLEADVAGFRANIAAAFEKACASCHGPDTSEGGLRIDELNPDLLTGPDLERWMDVFGALGNGEMPPEDGPDLPDEVRSRMVDWLSGEIRKASLVRRDDGGHSSFRRMTKYEYGYALQDLLGLPYDFAAKLPPESASEDGFLNSAEMLQMSALQFETYRDIGLDALRKATVIGDRPEPVRYAVAMQDVMNQVAKNPKAKFAEQGQKEFENLARRQHLFDPETGRGVQASNANWNLAPTADAVEPAPSPSAVVVFGPNDSLRLNLGNHLPDDGIMRVRIRAGLTDHAPDVYTHLRLVFGAHTSNNANFSQVISRRDVRITAPAERPEFVEFQIPLSEIPRNPFRKNVETFPRRDELLTIQTVSNSGGGRRGPPLRVHIDHIDITAPYFDRWPPSSHEAIFIPSEHRDDEKRYAREVLVAFMQRAWCRPVTESEVAPFVALFDQYRSEFDTFEAAMLEVLATVLATPEFLYLTERTTDESQTDERTISDREWAVRIAFFLWSSLPDEELLAAARKGELRDPDGLETQVRRMLADPRAERFSRHFVEQWLGLDGLESVDHIQDDSLKDAMREEPIAYFEEILRRNGSAMDLLHSDHLVVNERLAAHYGLPGVHGPHFRRVEIEPTRNRGGILTTAAVLAMNSDGTDSHPLKRGVWLLEHVLNDPPPPPPPDVPEVDLTDPTILQMTLKERIANHRDQAACRSCHAKIDPWGIAFENYDALGLYRTTVAGKPVDATSQLPSTQPLAGMEGLKRYLLASRQDQFARALVHKMAAYSLGRPLSFGDRAEIDRLTLQFRRNEDRLADLVSAIVASNLFRTKKD